MIDKITGKYTQKYIGWRSYIRENGLINEMSPIFITPMLFAQFPNFSAQLMVLSIIYILFFTKYFLTKKLFILFLIIGVWVILVDLIRQEPGFNLGMLYSLLFAVILLRYYPCITSIYVNIAYLFIKLYMISYNFTRFVHKDMEFSQGSSINAFGHTLFYIFIFIAFRFRVNSKYNERTPPMGVACIACALGLLCLTTVDSRQLIFPVLGLILILFINTAKQIKLILFFGIITIYVIFQSKLGLLVDFIFLFDAEKFALVSKGTQSERSMIWDCYMNRLNGFSFLVGSAYKDYGEVGSCAKDLINIEYLHSGILEFLRDTGLFGFLIILSLPLFFTLLLKNKDYYLVLIILFYFLYSSVELVRYWGFLIPICYIFVRGQYENFNRHSFKK